ncbi:hypothetical protein [Sphingobacterium daejeonense]|uniref:hypothetical protein n=1 Tax=Sphingobacterium daejeonense TaxID=371142 RepID=UPI0010C3245E|nr:hypothetical protein [Sphingobacterium daejeonense]VTP95862.1 Uncharacterised protein [Sphingobacterium daejeonense]
MLTGVEGTGKSVPPKIEHVRIYFLQKDQSAAFAQEFFDHYQSRNWKNRQGTRLSNWKSTAWEWILKVI